ncbi:YtpI family protein [Alkalicoccus halolimnae]|uniref:YtpI family protein n=1 Tax=Alkalicoccus halolimnae TaxID=1667239 RepID=A0A5C7FHX3_9BACI|nr:YtpI family protein [Alkalicoccus halolimnae]TXF85729.1 hypothetical protein FTX54_06535 [Alkalicoccus halolimnae]
MIIFPILIIGSLVMFVYFKVNQARSQGPAATELYNAKSSICLGIFILAFGINSYINLQTTTAAVIALIFGVLGGANLYFGFKKHQHFKPLARSEKQDAPEK